MALKFAMRGQLPNPFGGNKVGSTADGGMKWSPFTPMGSNLGPNREAGIAAAAGGPNLLGANTGIRGLYDPSRPPPNTPAAMPAAVSPLAPMPGAPAAAATSTFAPTRAQGSPGGFSTTTGQGSGGYTTATNTTPGLTYAGRTNLPASSPAATPSAFPASAGLERGQPVTGAWGLNPATGQPWPAPAGSPSSPAAPTAPSAPPAPAAPTYQPMGGSVGPIYRGDGGTIGHEPPSSPITPSQPSGQPTPAQPRGGGDALVPPPSAFPQLRQAGPSGYDTGLATGKGGYDAAGQWDPNAAFDPSRWDAATGTVKGYQPLPGGANLTTYGGSGAESTPQGSVPTAGQGKQNLANTLNQTGVYGNDPAGTVFTDQSMVPTASQEAQNAQRNLDILQGGNTFYQDPYNSIRNGAAATYSTPGSGTPPAAAAGTGGVSSGVANDPFLADWNRKQEEAEVANEARYKDIRGGETDAEAAMGGYLDRFNRNMAASEGLGRQELADVNQQYDRALGGIRQDLVGRGLAGTTIKPTMELGAARERADALGRTHERLRKEQIGLDTQLSADQLQFMERRTDAYPDEKFLAELAYKYGQGGAWNTGGNAGAGVPVVQPNYGFTNPFGQQMPVGGGVNQGGGAGQQGVAGGGAKFTGKEDMYYNSDGTVKDRYAGVPGGVQDESTAQFAGEENQYYNADGTVKDRFAGVPGGTQNEQSIIPYSEPLVDGMVPPGRSGTAEREALYGQDGLNLMNQLSAAKEQFGEGSVEYLRILQQLKALGVM